MPDGLRAQRRSVLLFPHVRSRTYVVFVRVVERPRRVRAHGPVEGRCALHRAGVAVLRQVDLREQLGAPETSLWWRPARDEDRVVAAM